MRSNEQLVQETLLAQLSEYQHQQQQQLDELNPFTGAAKAAGAVSGAIKGAGQKVAGTAKRATSAMGSAFKQGQTSAQKAVAGQDYKDTSAAQAAAAPAKARGSGIARGVGDALRTLGRGIGAAGDIKGKIDSYDYAAGTQAQQRAKSAGVNSVAQHWDAARDAKDAAKAVDTTQAAQPAASGAAQPAASAAPKVTATGGGVAPIATTGAAPKATTVPGQKPAATGTEKPAATSATPKATTVPGQKPAATGTEKPAATSAAPKATTVPGQKPAATGTEKPAAEPAKTAQDIAAKTGADAPTKKPDLKIAGQKVKPTDPLYDKLVAMIPAETRSSIDGLSDYDKGRLKKELSA
jgi:hypothetical protein